jgi:hypothetical protein
MEAMEWLEGVVGGSVRALEAYRTHTYRCTYAAAGFMAMAADAASASASTSCCKLSRCSLIAAVRSAISCFTLSAVCSAINVEGGGRVIGHIGYRL